MAGPIPVCGEKENPMSVPREYRQYVASELGCVPGEVSVLVASRDSNAGTLLSAKGVTAGSMFTSISAAEAATITQRNDTILVTPESHPWRGDNNVGGEVLTWDKTNTHVIGLSPTSKAGYNRARFSHSGYTMANFLTVSGDDNCFKNLRFMHGASTGGAADITCITVSGAGNRFEKVAFAGPNNATQAASNNYKGINITGSHNYFKDCMFGSVNDVDRSGTGAILYFGAACGGWNIFENCVFRSRNGGGQTAAFFITDAVTDTVVDYTAIFLNCQFLHQGTALALGISKAANTSRKLYFDGNCTIAGVTDIVADARVAEIVWGSGGSSPEEVAGADFKAMGKSRILVAT
jgi:hypothetical protein